MTRPLASGLETAIFGFGCFWGAERLLWQVAGVVATTVGYTGGTVKDPTYLEVCTNNTGHAEVVRAIYDPELLTYVDLLKTFWESHDPTQGMRQGNDVGSQYRSLIMYTTLTQQTQALASKAVYAEKLSLAGYSAITTEIIPEAEFFAAEEYHQRYLEKNPNGYCGIGGTGVSCPIGSSHLQ